MQRVKPIRKKYPENLEETKQKNNGRNRQNNRNPHRLAHEIEERLSMSRQEEVDYFLSSGHVWPCTIEMTRNHPFTKALKEVLLRLPKEVFYDVEPYVQFIVEAHEAFAFNVPFERVWQGNVKNPRLRLDTIVVYERSFRLSHEALVALLAHEIAHSVIKKKNHSENEDAADKAVISWGFGKELVKLQEEKKELAPTTTGQ